MQECELKRIIELAILKTLAETQGEYYVPVASSNRHIHLCRNDMEALFGKNYELKKMRNLIQPGQFACEEKVAIITPKGRIAGVRVLGPLRKQTQVEISATDSYKLGIPLCIRMSGDLEGSPGCRIEGPLGEIEINKGVIISARHLHMSQEEANIFGLKNKDIVKVRKQGVRSVTFDNIVVRAGEGHSLELHLDTDEANAAGIEKREFLKLVRDGEVTVEDSLSPAKEEILDVMELITEWDIKELSGAGKKAVKLAPKGIATPLAVDKAKDVGITILNLRG